MAKTALEQWDETAASNTDVGSVNIDEGCAPSGMNNAHREEMSQIAKWLGDDTLVSAGTTDLGSVPGRYVVITSTNAITALGTIKAGTIKYIKFSGILTFTHNATSLILPGAANITTAAGDTAIMVSEGSGNWRCVSYQRAAGLPVTYLEGTWTPVATFATPGNLSVVYSVQNGSYERIGRQVRVSGQITTTTFTHTTASGSFQITGLPFTSANVSPDTWQGSVNFSNIATARIVNAEIQSNSSTVVLIGSANGVALATLDTSNFPTATNYVLRFSIVYRV